LKVYESPSLEIINFEREMVMKSSACNCGYWDETNDMDAEQEGCEAVSAYAEELLPDANQIPWWGGKN